MGTAGSGVIPWSRPAKQSFPAWEYALLRQLRAPYTHTNLIALNYWAASEGTPPSQNNWLALADSSSHITTHATMDQGVQATASQLQSPNYGYPEIVAALRAGNSLPAIWGAINASGWCSGCQSGRYPTALYNAANPGFDLLSAPIYHEGSTATSTGSGTTAKAVSFTQCHGTVIGDHVGVFFGHGPSFTLLDACQAKALVGGLLVWGGVVLMGWGAVMLGMAETLRSVLGSSKSQVIRAVTSKTAVGKTAAATTEVAGAAAGA